MGRSSSRVSRFRASHGSGPSARTLLAALFVGLCRTGTSGDASAPLWTDPDSSAARQAAEWRLEGRA